jgi:hypothetical protein
MIHKMSIGPSFLAHLALLAAAGAGFPLWGQETTVWRIGMLDHASAKFRQPGQLDELSPFTHVASIPAIVDPSTIRFEKLKTVELASKTKTATDAQGCKERQFRDPDGSNCQTTTVVERVKAIEVFQRTRA